MTKQESLDKESFVWKGLFLPTGREVWRHSSTSHMLSKHPVEIRRSWKKVGGEHATHPNVLKCFPAWPDIQDSCVMRWGSAGREISSLQSYRQNLDEAKQRKFALMQKKEQGDLGAREVVSFHTELQHWNNAKKTAVQHTAWAAHWQGVGRQLELTRLLFSFPLSEMECFSALLGCYLENICLLYLVIYRVISKHSSIFGAKTFTYAGKVWLLEES